MDSEERPDKHNNSDNEFLIYTSQEIITRLNGIVGAINLIKNHEYSSAIKEMVESLDVSISNLEQFSYKVLLNAQLNSDQYNPIITEVNIVDLIQYNIIDLTDIIQLNNIHVITKKSSPNIFVNGDRDLLFYAFKYILHNAVRFSPKNDSLEIEIKVNNEKTVCSFLDHGNGFSQQALQRTFTPFQSPADGEQSKIGLSLYIVKRIMSLHKGEINIYNKEGAGAYVELVFNTPAS